MLIPMSWAIGRECMYGCMVGPHYLMTEVARMWLCGLFSKVSYRKPYQKDTTSVQIIHKILEDIVSWTAFQMVLLAHNKVHYKLCLILWFHCNL